MNCQRQGLIISVLFHLAVFLLLAGAMPGDSGAGRRVHMDFSIMDTAKSGSPAKSVLAVKKQISRVKREKPALPEEVLVPSEPKSREQRDIEPERETEAVEDAASGLATAGAAEHGARGRDFSYIKELLQRNLKYPAVARRKGWEGKVVVEFVICLNGSVRDIRVLETSGKVLLDNSAVDVVRNTEPFPEHSKETRVVIPIVYSLLHYSDT
jgi:TonB family protein